jgi:hypothetical protein
LDRRPMSGPTELQRVSDDLGVCAGQYHESSPRGILL